MSKKVVIHGLLLGALLVYAIVAWVGFEQAQQELLELERNNEDRWDTMAVTKSRAETAEGMVRVAVPVLLIGIYGGILAVIYGLPVVVEKVTEGVLGSTAKVDRDPMNDARELVEDEEYTEAITAYYQIWLKNRENRRPLVEIAKIQRSDLESPMLAVTTLEEGLEDHEWEEDDAAFLMFRLAEIFEEDLEDREKVREIMQRVVDELPGTRHAANAAQKLSEMDEED